MRSPRKWPSTPERNTDDIKQLIEENTSLTASVKSATDLLEEVHLHVANIAKKLGAEMGNLPPVGAPRVPIDPVL
jgi:hypothetical protein